MSSKDQKQPVKTRELEVILTFKTGEQKIGVVGGFEETIGETDVLFRIFLSMKDDRAVADLIKISLCQLYTEKMEDLIPAIRPNGKFFFDTDVNKDENTKRHAEIKNKYFKAKRKLVEFGLFKV